MTHGSLFSGIGGFDLAAEWMGWENKFHCEWNDFGKRVLKYYWPEAISYDNIKTTDFTIWRGNIDILTGGFPCQPFSVAGRQKGKDDERFLWGEMLRAIREIQPRWIVGENVYGILNNGGGMVFEQVCFEMENEGYEVQSYILPACSKNAPHKRDRVWFVAYSNSNREMVQRGNGNNNDSKSNSEKEIQKRKNIEFGISGSISKNDTNTNSNRYEGGMHTKRGKESKQLFTAFSSWDIGGKWEKQLPESAICIGDDGLSERLDAITFPKWRNESLKGYGNAIVPQVAFEIFKAIEQYEQLK